ncbi:MAG: ABC transporter ATP-binding protein, partial [Lachnospiraceae bacterium]|nr:ABC transporter ATP-binding protein [Lachnospiraceae bacterium]
MEVRNYKTGELFRRFLPYYAKYKKTLFFDLICAAMTTVCELVLPLIMRYITNEGINNLANLSVNMIVRLGVLYLVLRIVDSLANFYMADMGHVMGAEMETDMRRDAYNHLQKLSNTYYSNTKVGQIMGRITNDLFDVTEFAHHCPEEFFIAFIKAVISFVILAGIDIRLTLIIFLCIPLMLAVCMPLNFFVRATFRKQRNQIGELNARIEDSLLGHKVVKAFTNEAIENEKFEKDNQTFLGIKRQTYFYMAAFHSSVRIFDGLMYLIVLVAGGIFMIKGHIEPGDLVAYMLYVTTLIATIRRIIEFAEQFQRGMTGIERFLQILDADIEIFDEPDAVELKNPKGEIAFHEVSFEYPDDHNQVFRGLNLEIHAGEKLAIVGPSGGGKTTLCNLIPRFYDVTAGTITLDGKDIKKYTLKSLRGSIGVVQQDVYLFSGTVMENILYGRPGATREEVIEAAKKAGAHEFIMELKDGYDTYVGERGVKLSGGQKQRISIARV